MNKLEELVKSMSVSEVKAFRSAFGNSYTDTSFLNGFNQVLNNAFSTTAIYKVITGKKKFNDKEWRYLQTELTDRIENFLMLKYINENRNLHSLIKYKALAERNCFKAAKYFSDSLKNNNTVENATFFLQQFEAGETELMHAQDRTKNIDYTSVTNNLDAFHLAKKLQLFCEMKNYENVLTLGSSLKQVDELKLQAMQKPFSEIPVVQIYLLILNTLTEPETEDHFKKLNKTIAEFSGKLPFNELKDVYTYLKNYCVKKINQGNTSYIKILFDIYVEYIENKRLMNSEYFSQFEFKNIISLALRLNEAAWCKNFITKYINYLSPNERTNALNYNQAYYYFQTGDFKLSIRKLRDVEFTDIVYQLDSKVILLKAYFELDEDEQFFYHASAFRLYLLRNRHLSEYQKRINRNLIRFLTALRRNAGKPKKIAVIKDEILKEKNVADLNWLLSKVDDLL